MAMSFVLLLARENTFSSPHKYPLKFHYFIFWTRSSSTTLINFASLCRSLRFCSLPHPTTKEEKESETAKVFHLTKVYLCFKATNYIKNEHFLNSLSAGMPFYSRKSSSRAGEGDGWEKERKKTYKTRKMKNLNYYTGKFIIYNQFAQLRRGWKSFSVRGNFRLLIFGLGRNFDNLNNFN